MMESGTTKLPFTKLNTGNWMSNEFVKILRIGMLALFRNLESIYSRLHVAFIVLANAMKSAALKDLLLARGVILGSFAKMAYGFTLIPVLWIREDGLQELMGNYRKATRRVVYISMTKT